MQPTGKDPRDAAEAGASEGEARAGRLAQDRERFARAIPTFAALAGRTPGEQQERGYADTLREIAQQPVTWEDTAVTVAAALPGLRAFYADAGLRPGAGSLLLVGSGSSCYVGEALAPGLQAALGVPARAVPAGELLVRPDAYLPPRDHAAPMLAVSFARSGDSPESRAVVDLVLRRAPECRHLIVTCSAGGTLARSHAGDPRVHRLVLDDLTNDRSVVMTSSFTNMALAARGLAALEGGADFARRGAALAARGRNLLCTHGEALARAAGGGFSRAVYLGSSGRYGAAREASLKMLEMSAGRVLALPETFLGLRHGPMSVLDGETLIVAFVSQHPLTRAYELDLIGELRDKGLGAAIVVVGEGLPDALAGPDLVLVAAATLSDGELSDDDLAITDVLVGQWLAFCRCLALGQQPDAPSPDGVIARVVKAFAIHGRT
jgi:tagatose-6-phosphate ketose/aldose isomerase